MDTEALGMVLDAVNKGMDTVCKALLDKASVSTDPEIRYISGQHWALRQEKGRIESLIKKINEGSISQNEQEQG